MKSRSFERGSRKFGSDVKNGFWMKWTFAVIDKIISWNWRFETENLRAVGLAIQFSTLKSVWSDWKSWTRDLGFKPSDS